MKEESLINELKPYQPYGIPMLKFLFGLTLISLVITALYEFVI
uniref:Uncharacterized protein n=1 Tax=Candidatus Berkiella cookevillensis TaxID=437022 RepID=A0A0Q9YGU3_9GAMM